MICKDIETCRAYLRAGTQDAEAAQASSDARAAFERVAKAALPKMYAFMDESTGEIFLSAKNPDDEEWDTNHFVCSEIRNGRVNKHGSVMNILRNVLGQAGVVLEIL